MCLSLCINTKKKKKDSQFANSKNFETLEIYIYNSFSFLLFKFALRGQNRHIDEN